MKVVVIFPTSLERDCFLRHCSNKWIRDSVGLIKGKIQVTTFVSGIGKTNAVLALTFLQSYLLADYYVLAGFCGAENFPVGTVVFAQTAIDGDIYNLVKCSRLNLGKEDLILAESSANLETKLPAEVSSVMFMSCDRFIENKSDMVGGAKCVDMESHGFLRALGVLNLNGFVFKVVSDNLSKETFAESVFVSWKGYVATFFNFLEALLEQ